MMLICITVFSQTVTIGTGTSTARRPFGMYFGYERSVALYTAAEIASSGNITDLGWYIQALTSAADGPVKIYLKTTTASSLTANTWANFTTGATLVYDNATTTFVAGGWQTFNLSSPFAYSGDNLLVLVETNYGGGGGDASGTSKEIRYTTVTGTFETWDADNNPPTTNGTTNSSRPNIQITFAPSAALDAGISAINSPSTPVSSGVQNVNVTIKNYGTNPLTSTDIAWKVNGVLQTSYAWTGNIASTLTAGPVTVGTYNFATPGFYTIKAWTENPNAGTDANVANDTTTKTVFIQGYAVIPFLEDFDGTWINKNATRDVPTGYWANTPISGNQSWRRFDDGLAAAWSTTSGAYAPTGANSTPNSARFHSYDASSSTTGTMDLYLDFTTVGTKMLKFWYINTSGTDSLSVFKSDDGGSTFTFLQKFLTSAAWSEKIINLGTSVSPTTIIRFKATSDYGATDIGIDKVQVNLLQANDIAAVKWVSPVSGCGLTNAEQVTVKFTNVGNASQTSIALAYSINGGVTIVGPEFYTATSVNPGDTITYTFTQTADFSALGAYDCGFVATLLNDGDNSNDTAFANISNTGAINSYPFTENFETGNSNYLLLAKGAEAGIKILANAGAQNSFGLHMEGNTSTAWPITYSTAALAFAGISHISSASTCNVDATSLTELRMKLDLKQTYSYDAKYNWFMILANGIDTLADNTGKKFFNPTTSTADAFAAKTFDLTAYAGTNFTLTFKAVCKYNNASGSAGAGDNVFIDNINLFVPAADDLGVTSFTKPKSKLCGIAADSVAVIVSNFGTASQSNIPVVVSVITPSGTSVLNAILAGPLAPNASDTIFMGFVNTITPGNYAFKGYTDLATDLVFTNDTAFKTITISVPLTIPHMENFEGTIPMANWNSNFLSGNGHGNTSYVMFRNLYTSATTATAIFKEKIGAVSANSYLTFDYRITDYSAGTGTVLALDSIFMLLSNDCGSNYYYVKQITAANHVTSASMAHVSVPIGAFAGDNVIPAIFAKWNAGDYYLDFDNIAISDAPTVNLGADIAVCNNGLSTLDAGASAVGYTYTYAWSTLLHPATIATTQVISVDSSATYIVLVNNGYGVTDADTIVVTVNPLPVISLGSDVTSCLTSTIDAGAGFTSYLWSNAEATQAITANSTGNYWVEVENSFGCFNRDTVHVTILQLPTVDAGANVTICKFDTLTFSLVTATNYDSLLWTSAGNGHFNDSTLLNPIYYTGTNDTVVGSVVLTLTAYAVCDTVSSSMTLNYVSSATANAGSDVSICEGSSTQLVAIGGISYSWSPSAGLSATDIANPVANPVTTTTYTVTVTGTCGAATDDVNVLVDLIPVVNLGPDSTTCEDASVTLNAGAGLDSYAWSTGAITQTITVDTTGIGNGTFTYYVDVTNGQCAASDTVKITFMICTGINELNNEFTAQVVPNPNNGLFTLTSEGSFGSTDLNIYTLHGQLVYSEKLNINGSYAHQFDLSSMPKGIYMVKLFNEKSTTVTKLVIE